MSHATVDRILSIERQAADLHHEASAQAARILADVGRQAAAERETALGEARVEADRIEEQGRRAAEAARNRILARAAADAQDLEDTAASNAAAAVRYILDEVMGIGRSDVDQRG